MKSPCLRLTVAPTVQTPQPVGFRSGAVLPFRGPLRKPGVDLPALGAVAAGLWAGSGPALVSSVVAGRRSVLPDRQQPPKTADIAG